MGHQKKCSRKDIPVILTAFGTTTRAVSTYGAMDAIFKETLPDQHLVWAYTSRMVKSTLNKKQSPDIKDPGEVLARLQQEGHEWAVLQSLHLIGGHELHRLAAERYHVNIRLSMGLPLLSSPRDFKEVAVALAPVIPADEDEAVLMVGHGTDHPSWTAYFALEAIARDIYGPRVFTGVLEGFPPMEATLDRIRKSGYKKVRLIPLLLVAGTHFLTDLTGEEHSWQKTLERHNITVSVVSHGVGALPGIARIFSRHIQEALDVIPL